jgi:hypothetical protein
MLADSMFEVSGTLIPIIAVGGGLLIPIVAIIAHSWRKMRHLELEIGLKNEMIARGMSAEEIERVIRATGASELDSCHKTGSHADSRV